MSKGIGFIRGDIVRFPHCGRCLRGRYIAERTKLKSEVSVHGGPSCFLKTTDLDLVARPERDGFRVYLHGIEIGTVKSVADINPLRAKFRAGAKES